MLLVALFPMSIVSDHSRSVKDFKKMGIPIFAPYIDGVMKGKLGGFKISAFELPHDNCKNYGFLINYNGNKLLYLTDFEYCTYFFTQISVQNILIECNYQQKYISREDANYLHKVKGHCELETCKRFIEVNRTDKLRNVILCHLGRFSTNADECKAEIEKVAKTSVYVATKGLEVDLERRNDLLTK